jgi:RimJ/RimL family protein N-acetyltransferase
MRTPLREVELTGKYARLVPLRLEHAEALVAAASPSRATYQLTPVPSDLASAKEYIQFAIDTHQQGISLPFAIIDIQRGQVVGTTRFLAIEYWKYPDGNSHQRPPTLPHIAEIGFTWLAEAAQRTGINTDVKLSLLSYAFEHWKLLRVNLKTDERNARSRANIERIGAKFDGVLRAHQPSADGGIRNSAFYSILIEEWPAVKKRLQEKLR